MTLPNERFRAVNNAREFLRSLLDPKKTPRVPEAIRKQAYYVLKHYPGDLEMRHVAMKAPNVFKLEMD